MENMADKTLFMNEPAMDRIAPLKDPREMKYRLAVRLADNMQLGEAIRILEALGDYSDSRTLIEEYRSLKAYSDDAEEKLRDERSSHAQASARKDAERRRRLRMVWAALAVATVALWFIAR